MPSEKPSGAQVMSGEYAPKLVRLADEVLFGQVRPDEGS